jgi:alpha/beta superfamily hydrolase
MQSDAVPALAASAVRTDEAGGYREILEFVGDGPERLAGCTYVPSTPAVGGVVVCPSLFNEFMKNYRREVLLARSLAARGIAVQRFNYRGTGNSDGEPEDITFERLCEDVAVASARLAEVAGVERPALLGTRFGALVAAAASSADATPVAFFEPVLAADRFFTEGVRARAATDLLRRRQTGSTEGTITTTKEFVAALQATGAVDVVGYTVGRPLHRSATGRTLSGELGERPRPVLLVQLGGDGPVRPDLEKAAAGWRELGFSVDLRQAGTRELWWFSEERDAAPGEIENRPQGLDEGDPVVGLLGTWLEDRLREDGGA